MEYRLFEEDTIPYQSTADYHAERDRAPHLEQGTHVGRLNLAAEMVRDAVHGTRQRGELVPTVVDLGCGDGGLLSLIKDDVGLLSWGYDFTPANAAGWAERGVQGYAVDVFGADRGSVRLGSVVITTEVLEHLADPHGVVRWIGGSARFIVASSPWNENAESHDACHTWAWDMEGYRALIEQGGFTVVRHEKVGQFQVILGERR